VQSQNRKPTSEPDSMWDGVGRPTSMGSLHIYVTLEGGWVPSKRDKTWRGEWVGWAERDVTPTI